jgi:alkylhydroperoxidase/carboxymuconolactone decarboxylase family protein YurZ
MHLRAALRNGVTAGELQELLLQVGVYWGLPAANAAFRLAEEELEAAGRARR